jgi:hypothetical protein
MEEIKVNKYQTPITEELLKQYPQEIQDMLGRVGLGTIIKFETNQEIIDSVREKRFHNLKEEAIQKINERRHKLLEDFAAKNDVVCYTMRLGQDE